MQAQQTTARCITLRGELALDLSCVAVSVLLTAGVLHDLQGIGVGTVVGALTYGRLAGLFGRLIDQKFDFVSVLSHEK